MRLIGGADGKRLDPILTKHLSAAMANICHPVHTRLALMNLVRAGKLINEPAGGRKTQYRLPTPEELPKPVDSKAVGSTQSEGAAE